LTLVSISQVQHLTKYQFIITGNEKTYPSGVLANRLACLNQEKLSKISIICV